MADQEKLTNDELEQEAMAAEPEEPAKESKPAVKKTDKPVKKQKPSLFARIGKWFRDLRAEARKVIWPTKKQVVNNTLVVIVMVIVVAIFVAALDLSFQEVRNFLARLLA